MVTSQAAALDAAVGTLELGPEHDLLVAYCRGIAEQIDLFPSRATLWREYRPAVELLVNAGRVEEDDGQATFLQLVSTPVGDAKKPRKGNARAGGSGSGGNGGAAVDAVAGTGRQRRPRTAS